MVDFLHYDQDVQRDAANSHLTDQERRARSFVRMCLRQGPGLSIFFHSSVYPAETVARGIELLAQLNRRAELIPAPARRRRGSRGSPMTFDCGVVFKLAEQKLSCGPGLSRSVEAVAALHRFQPR